MPILLKLCLWGSSSSQNAEAQMAQQMADGKGKEQGAQDEGDDVAVADAYFSSGKHTLRT